MRHTPVAGRRPAIRIRPGGALSAALLVALAIVFAAPLLWLLDTALKDPAELAAYPIHLVPRMPEWHNFGDALTLIDYAKYARNSLFLSALSMALLTLSSAMVGFGFARLRGRGQRPLFVLMLATTMLPPILLVIPTYALFARLGLIYNYWPWVLWGLGANPVLAFLCRQFFAGIPLELEDAAIVDGCGHGRIFWQMFLPLSKPVLATVAIFSFQWTWDDWFRPLLFLTQDNTTLAVAMTGGYADASGHPLTTILAAGTLIYALPVIVIFLLAQRYFVQGITTSGLKG